MIEKIEVDLFTQGQRSFAGQLLKDITRQIMSISEEGDTDYQPVEDAVCNAGIQAIYNAAAAYDTIQGAFEVLMTFDRTDDRMEVYRLVSVAHNIVYRAKISEIAATSCTREVSE